MTKSIWKTKWRSHYIEEKLRCGIFPKSQKSSLHASVENEIGWFDPGMVFDRKIVHHGAVSCIWWLKIPPTYQLSSWNCENRHHSCQNRQIWRAVWFWNSYPSLTFSRIPYCHLNHKIHCDQWQNQHEKLSDNSIILIIEEELRCGIWSFLKSQNHCHTVL